MAGFRNYFSDINDAHYVIWNNKDIKIDNKPIFYKKKMQIVESFMLTINYLIGIMYVFWNALRIKDLNLTF